MLCSAVSYTTHGPLPYYTPEYILKVHLMGSQNFFVFMATLQHNVLLTIP